MASVRFFRQVCRAQGLRSFSGTQKWRCLGLQQIAIGSLDKPALSQLWGDVFGLKKLGSFVSEKENVDEDIMQLGKGLLSIEVDLMTPLNPDKSPRVHVPPLNHIGLWIDDLETAVEDLVNKGVRFTPGGIRAGASGHNVTFIHPKGNEKFPICGQGVLLELVQAPAEVIAEFDKQKE